LLLPTTLEIPGVAGPHVCALKVACEDQLEILPTIDQVSRQVIEPDPGRIGQVNVEELDDEEVIICPACSAREAIVLQPNAGVGFAIIFDDVI
jgi:hypothetical protein